jgi:hypothetical protein
MPTEKIIRRTYRAVLLLTEETYPEDGEQPVPISDLLSSLREADILGVAIKVESLTCLTSRIVLKRVKFRAFSTPL